MKYKAFFKHIAALLLFGSNGIVASFINLSSLQIVLLRTLIGGGFLLALFFISGGRITLYKHKKQALFLTASGIAMGISWMLLYEAYARVGVGIATLLYYCGPILVMALSPLLFKEKLTAYKIGGFFAVIIGVIFINGNAVKSDGNIFGIVCGMLSAVLYACMVIFNKKAAVIQGLENSVFQLVTAFLTVAAFVGTKYGFTMQIESTSILPILILGLLNTGVGCYLYFSSIDELKVQTVAVCGYLEPLSAVLFSVLFLKEFPAPLQIIGAVLIIGGAVTANR